LNKLGLICLFLSIAVFGTSVAAEERIPISPTRQASDDLLFQGATLSSEEAWILSRNEFNPIDLSLLNPKESEVWRDEIVSNLNNESDNIPFDREAVYDFNGVITSNQGIFRFNVIKEDNTGQVYTILMEKTLHTALLRKNLLRKLGYQIPAMKYAKDIKLKFQNKEQRDNFLTRQLPEATYGAPSRWLGRDHKNLKDEELTLALNDVVVFLPSETDHYNLAMGVPPKRLTNRTLRSLLVPYSILDLGESVNKFAWSVGRIDSENIILPHFASANMNTTMDDAKWALRRLAKLKREDFTEVVDKSNFPHPVDKILVEKIISRRNSLIEIFEIEASEIPVNSKLTVGELLKEGTIAKEDWSGYASRFAHGEPDSPFKDFQYFVFSKLQDSTIQSLLDVVNEELSLFNPGEKRLEFIQGQFEEGLDHFVETGEFLEFGVGTWFSPTVDGRLILSRDIVVGNYLGTDNLVQLADTVGVSVSLGGILGIENLPQWPTASIAANVSAMRTYTHLKPVQTLKASFKEPYKNMIVPLMKLQLRKKLDELADIPNQDVGDIGEDDIDPRLKAIEDLMGIINTQLGVGESILVTDRLTPRVMANGSFSMMETKVSLGAGTSGVMVRRLHLFRKDAKTIQVYEDKGRGLTLSLNAGIDNLIPIVKVSTDRTKGKYKVKLHTVNINQNLEENPELFSNAKALHYLLEEGSSELLEAKESPWKIETEFLDKSTKMSFLVWRSKYLNGDADLAVTAPSDNRTEYISLTRHSQSGINYQSFAYDVLNYYLKDWTKDLPITPQLNPERYKNPGQSIFGVSVTHSSKLEARKKNGLLSDAFLSLTERREGWSASSKKLKKYIEDINERYGTKLFDKRALDNAEGLRLFDISVNINVYDRGIDRLSSISNSEIQQFSREYSRERDCNRSRRLNRIRTASVFKQCVNLNNLIDQNNKCKKMMKKTREHASCVLELARDLNRDLEFPELAKLLGAENFFVYGAINGFRRDSEILNEPIQSNTIGKVRGRYWNGPLDRLREIMQVQNGEFNGLWIRESL